MFFCLSILPLICNIIKPPLAFSFDRIVADIQSKMADLLNKAQSFAFF